MDAPTPCFAIFGPNQIEYPGQFVVRRFLLDGDFPPIPDYKPTAVVRTLDEARSFIPVNSLRFDRDAADDPSVIESYIPSEFFGV